MLHAIIEQTQSIINDSHKQSFGSLEYFLEHIIAYRDEKQYKRVAYPHTALVRGVWKYAGGRRASFRPLPTASIYH
ncbi:hypothetical protein [Paenibacillus xylanexedens]|uniref:hypothetical protein n=1 Tax=Paenibacillus xylanexedens TaxID=528191 RepID=UPI001C92E913|nr:hypothetical protein [Paenibacillus xylanexedens]